jgi:AraC family transcriptional activator of pyochelin receptor
MQLEAGDVPRLDIDSPTAFAVLSEGETYRNQVFSKESPFSVVLLQIDRGLVEREFGRDAASLLTGTARRADRRLVVRAGHADAATRAVGAQLLTERHSANGFFRCAKALELAALAFEGLAGDERQTGGAYLTPSDRERIRTARDMLVQNAADPPDLTTVARLCGTNLSKLNQGFRTVYGMAPYRYVQEFRLQRAYEMLSSRNFTVSQVAVAMGYTPAHFSTLFKRRHGIRPSDMVPHAAHNP